MNTPNTQGASWREKLEKLVALSPHINKEAVPFLKVFIEEIASKERASFGGCTSCYGKGYSTVKSFLGGRHFLVANDPYEPCPKCDRGKQIAELIAKERAEGERRFRDRILVALRERAELPNNLMDMEEGKVKALYLSDVEGVILTLPTDSTEKKCCEKCYTSDYVEGQVVAIGCLNPYCTCHPNTQDSTEEITNKD